MKFFNFNKPASKPNALNPVAVPNLSLGLGGFANNTGTSRMNSAVPEFSSPSALDSILSRLHGGKKKNSSQNALGNGIKDATKDMGKASTPFEPIKVQSSNKIVSPMVELPPVPQMAPIQQAPLPTGKADYNPLFELQKLIERQRAGY